MIQVQQLSKHYGDGHQRVDILNQLDFVLSAGESVAITGESGSGKSTLLHLIAALDKADSGKILFHDKNIETFTTTQADIYRKVNLGIVFQRFNLIDCLNVWDNVSFSPRLNQNYDARYIDSLLERLGIIEHKHKYPADLSGGEQQRVAITRALAHRPHLLLADEPTGNLDNRNSDKVANLLFQVCQEQGTALLMATHSHHLASLAQRQLSLVQGKLRTALSTNA